MAEIFHLSCTGHQNTSDEQVALTPAQSCSVESGRWTDAIEMLDRLWGPINIGTLERFAPAGNKVPPCIYQGASHQGALSQIGFVSLRVQFVRTLSQLWKSLQGLVFFWDLVLKRVVMLSLPLAVRREKQCEGSLSISEPSSNSHTATEMCLAQISLLTSAFQTACCSRQMTVCYGLRK